MGTKIPRELRLEVLRKWLQGKSRDQIANEVGIGAGTVSSIIKEYRSGDFDADLLREVALDLKNQGLDIQKFASLVRLREVLKEKEWLVHFSGPSGRQQEGEEESKRDYEIDLEAEKKMESLIMSLEVFCFKQNLSVKQFFDFIHSMYYTAEKFDIPIEDFHGHIEELKNSIESLLEQIRDLQSAKQAALEKYQMTERLLEEFRMSRPLFDAHQRLKQKLEQTTMERDSYKLELYHERLWKRKEEDIEWSISERNLDKANKELVERTGGYACKGQIQVN